MGLWPTHRDESAFLRLIDSKRVTPRLSTEVMGILHQLTPLGIVSSEFQAHVANVVEVAERAVRN
jgi:hypothetical protein